jgi:glutamate 5-kinase
VVLDAGAVRVLREAGKSLLAVGIVGVSGAFHRGDVVVCRDIAGKEVARGLSNYSATEVKRLKGQSSDKIIELLGYAGDDEIIHRDNLILIES